MPLPVLQPEGTIRRSRTTRWRAAVLVAIHLLIAAHITHWLVSGRTVTPVEPSEAAALARSGIVNTGLVFFAVTILLTAVFGRLFCGWACHLVALQDLSRALFERFGHRPKPLRSRLLRWVPAAAFLYAFVLPAVARYRAGSPGGLRTEFTTSEFWATFPGWIVGASTFLVCGVLAIWFLGAKGFCTYACPYGAAFAVAEKVSPFRIRVTDACEGCGHCTAVCTSNVRVHEEVRDWGMVVDSGCMKCMDCVSVCPNDALYYGPGPIPLLATRRAEGRKMERFPLGWPEEAVLASIFLLSFLTFRGLYGAIPFLMALGIAGVFAALALLTFQLFSRPHVRFKGWHLKRAGRILPAGRGLLAVVAVLTLFWIHSGAVRWQIARGDTAGAVLARWQRDMHDVAVPRPSPSAAERRTLTRSLRGYEAADRIGFVSTTGAAARRASLHYLLGDDDAAAGQAELALRRGELPAAMQNLLGRIALGRGEAAAAEDRFARAVEADPHDPVPAANLGIALARSGNLERAREVFLEALADHGESPALIYDLALVEAWSGDLEAAATGFSRVLALDADHLPARENLAGTLAVLGRLGESAAHYAEAVGRSPRDAATRVLYAQVLAAGGRFSEARQQADAALELEPGLPAAVELDRALAANGGKARPGSAR